MRWRQLPFFELPGWLRLQGGRECCCRQQCCSRAVRATHLADCPPLKGSGPSQEVTLARCLRRGLQYMTCVRWGLGKVQACMLLDPNRLWEESGRDWHSWATLKASLRRWAWHMLWDFSYRPVSPTTACLWSLSQDRRGGDGSETKPISLSWKEREALLACYQSNQEPNLLTLPCESSAGFIAFWQGPSHQMMLPDPQSYSNEENSCFLQLLTL